MFSRTPESPLFDFISSLSRAMDLLSPAVVNHHMQVAYIALNIGRELKVPANERRDLVLAGCLHDIGAFSLFDRLRLLRFEAEKPHEHAEAGYLLLKLFGPFAECAEIVRFHHVPWDNGAGARFRGFPVPRGSHLLHLADRVAVSIQADGHVLRQVNAIRERINEHCGHMFVPEFVEAFDRIAAKEYFWLEATSGTLESILRRNVKFETIELGLDELVDFACLICRIIDFKSAFTATHSSGVAASAVALSALAGFSPREQQMIKVAAYLHDVGKLAIPSEILEKPGKLTEAERDVMRSHVYYTYEILHRIEGLDVINEWSSMHQERMDGHGYPFHYDARDLSLGARIMAVADVFTAITEDRPYRRGMPKEEALALLQRMADNSELDRRLVGFLNEHYDEVNVSRVASQQAAMQQYQEFAEALGGSA